MTRSRKSTAEFLSLVFQGLSGWTCIAEWPGGKYGQGSGITKMVWFRIGPNFQRDFKRMVQYIEDNKDRDLYFSPYVFKKASQENEWPSREAEYATATRVIHADADEFHPSGFRIAPSVVWRTSPERYQCLWLLDEPNEPNDAILRGVAKSVSVTHSAEGCDKSGHPVSKLLRVPGTTHNKTSTPHKVTILRMTEQTWGVGEIAAKYPAMTVSSRTTFAAEGEPFDLNKGRHANILDAIQTWNKRFADGQLEHRYEAALPIVKEVANAGLTVENAVWAAEQCEPLMDKQAEENGYRISRDIPKMWDKADCDRLADRANRHLKPVPNLSKSTDESGEPQGRFDSLDWTSAWQEDFSKPDWLPGMILERGQQMTLAADGKAGKSLVVLEWCCSMVLGRPFLGHTTGEKLTILYFDKENSKSEIITRLRCIGITEKDLPELQARFIYKQFPDFSGGLNDRASDGAEEFLEIVAEVQPDLVILDTASRFIVGKENDSDTWLQLYQLIHAPLKKAKIACIRIDHFGKDSDKGARGSSAKSQDVDHVWELTKEHESKEKAPEGEWVITRLKLKRTHTRTGHGDDVMSVTRKGKKTGEKTWAEGCTSHQITGSSDLVEEAATEADAYTIILAKMKANIGQSYTVKDGVEILKEAGSNAASESTVTRVFRQMTSDAVMKKKVAKGKRGRAVAYTYYA